MPRIHDEARSRAFVFTWNNYPEDHREILRAVDSRYVLFGREICPGTGTPHLQGYVYFKHAKTARAAQGLLVGCHVERAKGSFTQNYDYCTKSGDFDTHGEPPLDDRERGLAEKERYVLAWNLAKIGDIESIDADIRVRLYPTLRRIEKDFMPPVANLASVCGIWIYGESGSGKTRSVLGAFPHAFIKPRSQWWCGYQNEPVVLCDDVDKFDVRLGGFFKHWADYAAFIGEFKGGARRIRPEKFIVTSQYRIEDIWQDIETRAALGRRFVCIDKVRGQDIIIL